MRIKRKEERLTKKGGFESIPSQESKDFQSGVENDALSNLPGMLPEIVICRSSGEASSWLMPS